MIRFLFKLIFVAILAVALFVAYGLLLPTGPQSQQLIQLKPGSSARHIAADLKQAGIIRSQYAFLLWHFFLGKKSFKAGEYAFDHNATMREVCERIAGGYCYFTSVRVTREVNHFG